MNGKRFAVFAVFLVVAAAATVAWLNFSKEQASNRGLSAAFTSDIATACETLTLEEAKSITGENTKLSSGTGIGDREDADLKVTNCGYVRQGQAVGDGRIITLSVFAAKTQAGADQNKSYFTPDKSSKFEAVGGYGDSAYWDEFSNRLYIIDGNNYYTISESDGLGAARSGELTQALAVAAQASLKR